MAVKFSAFSHQAYYCIISEMKTEVTFSAFDRRTPNSVTNVKKDHGKCHNLSPMFEEKTPDHTWRVWTFEMTACHPNTHLYGPACLRESRGLIYPCERKKCVIRCPCSVCAGVVHQESGHSRRDRFDIHQQYHSAPHLNCIFCAEMMRLLPGHRFLKVITVRESGQVFPSPLTEVLRKAFEFRHNYKYPDKNDKRHCEECGKHFKKACNRERHMENVHYQQKYKCLQCGKLFGRADNLTRHTKVHQASTADNAESSDEAEDLSDESIKEHSEMDDTSTDNTESDESEKELNDFPNNSESGNDDGRTDDSDSSDSSKTSKIECDRCGKDFSTMFNLKVHSRKPKYNCQECNDVFCSKSALSAHMKAKHGNKDFKCTTCSKEFSTKQNLNRHLQNQSANTCVQCSAVFCNAHALKCHVYSDHICKKCPICGGKYEYYHSHMESVHGSCSTKTSE